MVVATLKIMMVMGEMIEHLAGGGGPAGLPLNGCDGGGNDRNGNGGDGGGITEGLVVEVVLPDGGGGGDGLDDDEDERFIRRVRRIFGMAPSAPDPVSEQGKVKEADMIKLPAFPAAETYRNWRIKTRAYGGSHVSFDQTGQSFSLDF